MIFFGNFENLPRAATRRRFAFPECASGLFPARPGQLPFGAASTPFDPRGHAVEKSRPLSRVLSWTVIPLGCASPRSSSDLPGSLTWTTWCGRHAPRASLFGLAPGGACAALRRYLSVALSVGSRPPGVTWHRALWSPDFPPSSPACADEDSDCLADSWRTPYADMATNARRTPV